MGVKWVENLKHKVRNWNPSSCNTSRPKKLRKDADRRPKDGSINCSFSLFLFLTFQCFPHPLISTESLKTQDKEPKHACEYPLPPLQEETVARSPFWRTLRWWALRGSRRERTILHRHEGSILQHKCFSTELAPGVISCFRKISDTDTCGGELITSVSNVS